MSVSRALSRENTEELEAMMRETDKEKPTHLAGGRTRVFNPIVTKPGKSEEHWGL